MKIFNVILTVAVVFCALSMKCLALPSMMVVYPNCFFKVDGNILKVDVYNQPAAGGEFSLDVYQVTLIRKKVDGSISVSVHKKGTDYRDIEHAFDISAESAAKMGALIPTKQIYWKSERVK
jgi:hypothetical protein